MGIGQPLPLPPQRSNREVLITPNASACNAPYSAILAGLVWAIPRRQCGGSPVVCRGRACVCLAAAVRYTPALPLRRSAMSSLLFPIYRL